MLAFGPSRPGPEEATCRIRNKETHMSTTTLILIILVIVLLFGGFGYRRWRR